MKQQSFDFYAKTVTPAIISVDYIRRVVQETRLVALRYRTKPIDRTVYAEEDMLKNKSSCLRFFTIFNSSSTEPGLAKSLSISQLVPLIFLLGVFFAIVAKFFNYIRKSIYKEQKNIDSSFDAGGKVSTGLTATTLVSQWTWAATLLQSSAVAAKYGISGPFWYASGACIQFLLFAMISVQLKVRAPGAKTFLQVIRARFGSKTHLVFCVFALLTNIIVTAMLMLGGAAIMTNLVDGLSIELATMLVVAVIWTFTHIGGLGATFYVSYFNTATIFIITIAFLVHVYHTSNAAAVGSMKKVYDRIVCSKAPEGNKDSSFLTLVSRPGLMFGIINIVGNFGTVFVDQSYWQSSVAAKPKNGVWGFLSGGLVWFAVPFTFATTMGLAYISMSVENGRPLLTESEVNDGLVPAVVAQRLLGARGELLILILVLMAVTSTGSAEVVAVSSILIYDVYCLYWKPYRLVHDANSCILCGRARGRAATKKDKCICISMTFCAHCKADDERRNENKKRALKAEYQCTTHGSFRKYNDYLEYLKDWSMLWVSLAILPLTLILKATSISLGWLYLFMGILIGSAVLPITLCMFWPRLTGIGMVTGALSGTLSALIVWLSVSSITDNGLSDFFNSTAEELPMLCGNITSIAVSCIVTIIVSLITNRYYTNGNDQEIWENTRDIDNPLSPWVELYARELDIRGVHELDKRPSLQVVTSTFKQAKIIAMIGAICLTLIFIIIWPGSMASAGILDFSQFRGWIVSCEIWGVLAAIFIIVMPFVSEAIEIKHKLREKNMVAIDVKIEPKVKRKVKVRNVSDSVVHKESVTDQDVCVVRVDNQDERHSSDSNLTEEHQEIL
ncbi:DgyrCDS11664 [Dimorphilus gyrociliatus]|uniref:DgyrCDS11664 n=1 Tax=Dimorphilus gyrociliatus TaxID=2664684 RepID=A0A7I8W877_9ANNE|nr:DgyrCDS11664 [Dimorphilus gyrociliatus]